jgi:hypothetical protein
MIIGKTQSGGCWLLAMASCCGRVRGGPDALVMDDAMGKRGSLENCLRGQFADTRYMHRARLVLLEEPRPLSQGKLLFGGGSLAQTA